MMNYKKLKNGFSMAELLVALSIFALISILGVSGFSFMLRNQIKHRSAIENRLIEEVKTYNCKKELYYLYKQTPNADTANCSNPLTPCNINCSDLQESCKSLFRSDKYPNFNC